MIRYYNHILWERCNVTKFSVKNTNIYVESKSSVSVSIIINYDWKFYFYISGDLKQKH